MSSPLIPIYQFGCTDHYKLYDFTFYISFYHFSSAPKKRVHIHLNIDEGSAIGKVII